MANFEPIFSGLTRSANSAQIVKYLGVGHDFDRVMVETFKLPLGGRLCGYNCVCGGCGLGADFAPILSTTFNFEGGYGNNPKDSGNYTSSGKLVGTNHGIAAITYEQYLKREPTVSEMKALTQEKAKTIYKSLFWDKIYGDDIKNQSVAWAVFDVFVNSGYTGLYLTRRAMNKTAGKTITPETKKALSKEEVDLLNGLNQEKFFINLKTNRLAHVQSLAESNPAKYGGFINGWTRRINDIVFSGASAVARNPGISFTGLVLIGGVATAIVYRKQIVSFIKNHKQNAINYMRN